MAISIMFSSTLVPLKDSSPEKNNIETIMTDESTDQGQENKEDSGEGKTITDDSSTSPDDKSEEQKPAEEIEKKTQQSIKAELYTDSSYSKPIYKDYEIIIKGYLAEASSIKAYIIENPNFNQASDREDIISFAYEIFDKDNNICQKKPSDTFQIELRSKKIDSKSKYLLYGKSNGAFKEINIFDRQDGLMTFASRDNQFLLQKQSSSIEDKSIDSLDDNSKEILTYQNIYASIYKDKSYEQKAYDQTKIKLSGRLPVGVKVKAYPVEIKIEGQEVLAAYDITVFDEKNNEYKVGPENKIKVKITNKKIEKAKKVEVYHKENEFAPEERIDDNTKTDDTVAFKADDFSIYAVIDPEGQNIKFVFFYQDKDGKNIIWDVQNIRNGEKLIQPELPIFSHDGKFEGWYYYDYGNKDKTEEERFGEKFDFDKAVSVDKNSPDVIYLKGKYPEVLIINFVDKKKYKKDDGSFGYVDEILSTKQVHAGGKIPSDDIPVISKESETVFSHWSLEVDGKTPFDFNRTITKDFIRQYKNNKSYGELNLYAVYKKALTVTFESQGGTHVNRQIVYSGDKIVFSDLTKPVKPGYEFKYWSESPNGPAFNKDRIISANTKLYAVYSPQVVKYTINHWIENANDDGYSILTTESRAGNAGTLTNGDSATYKLSSQEQNNKYIIYDHADPPKVINGNASTEINLYYKRKTFTLRIYEGVATDIVKVKLKWGAQTQPYLNQALKKLGNNYTFKENNFAGKIITTGPDMPRNDYTLLAWREGKNDFNVRFIDIDTNELIRLDQKTSHVSPWLQRYDGGETIKGFTYKYVESPGSNSSYARLTHGNGQKSDQYEIWVYYSRNKWNLTFSTNGNGEDIVKENVPYDKILSEYLPKDYVVDISKNAEGKVFAGWYDNPEGLGNPIDFSKKTMPDNNLKVYAKWDLPKFKVIAYRQRNNPAAGTSEQIIKEGGFVDKSKLSADKPPIAQSTPGSELRWYAFIDGVLVEYNFSEPVTSDIYLYPVWLAPVGNELRPLSQIYRVKYRAPGSSGEDVIYLDPKEYVNNAEAIIVATNIDKNYRFPDGSIITMPADQVFQGWVIDKDSDFTTVKEKEVLNKVYQPGDIINVVGNIMFKPLFNKYQLTKLTLKETSPSGEVLPDVIIEKRVHKIKLPDDIKDPREPEDLRVNDTTVLPAPKATDTEGYKFLGWSTTKDGKNAKIFAPGQKVLLTNENLPNVLYGIWQANRTIKLFDSKEDSTSELIKEVNLEPGEVYKLPILQDRAGYKFLGFSTNENATFPDYKAGESITADENTPLPERLYAVWQKVKKITFHNTNIDYTPSYSQADDVTIKVSYLLNGEKYEEPELKIKHNQSVTIQLPIEAMDVKYQVIPIDYFKLVSLTPEKLDGRLGNRDGDILVEIKISRKRLTYDSNIESIYFDGIKYTNGSSIISPFYTKTVDKDAINRHHTDEYMIKDHLPQGFNFLGWSSTPDGKNMVDYTKDTYLKDIKEERLYAIWSRPKEFKFKIEKENPNDETGINFTAKLDNYYEIEKSFKTNSEVSLYTPTASDVTDIVVNSSEYSYEIIKPTKAEVNGKFDTYTYIIKIKNNPPVPTGIIDDIGPMILLFALAIIGFVLRLYKKYLLKGGFDE